VWTCEDEPVEEGLLRGRVQAALGRRIALGLDSSTNACRLIHAESDLLPGLIVDRYADVLVMQCLTAGAELWRESLADLLLQETGARAVYERSDADVRALEGLPPRAGPLRGRPPSRVQILEYGLQFLVDIEKGHKTGFYLDQRENRHLLQAFCAGREVLNCFSYTGGFTVHALAAGAESVLSVDTSADALSLGRENVGLNGLPGDGAEWSEADVFQALRKYRDEARSFDLVILDPPKFAHTSAQAERAARGYKDINLLAFKLLRPGGVLFTFSCSGGVEAALFQKIVASAALDAGVDAIILRTMTQAPDHPVLLSFPEGAYLKGLVCARI
jgi:23S rRNA (cytosine1962-C5)-methyltransferase